MKLVICILLGLMAYAQGGLKEYVGTPDASYKWKFIEKHEIDPEVEGYSLELTSQTWHGIEWKHALRVVMPVALKDRATNGILIIGGSRREGKERVEGDMKRGLKIALSVGAPVILLYDIPVQPLFGDLKEDKLLAETFTRYKASLDESWPIIFPMVKATVRAMDAMQEFLKKEKGLNLEKFLVTGASKRGWTTWFMPVVDERVFGIAPLVYDNLNLTAQMQYQLESWGEYSPSIRAYTEKDLPQKLLRREKPVTTLAEMIDPFTFVKEIKVPKLLVHGTNDPFWVVDAARNYLDQLEGKTYLHYSPNAGHGLDKHHDEVISSVATFFKYLDGRIQLPKIEYEVISTGDIHKIQYAADIEPFEVALMTAESPTRDFRKAEWKDLMLLEKRGRYSRTVTALKDTHQAFYCQAVYYLDGEELTLSTPIKIVFPAKPVASDSTLIEKAPEEPKKEAAPTIKE